MINSIGVLILSPEIGMSDKWVRNLSTYVENGQSILLLDKVVTGINDVLAETFGYDRVNFEFLKLDRGDLKITEEHAITRGFSLNDDISLDSCWGNMCKEVANTGTVVAEFIEKGNKASVTIPSPGPDPPGSGCRRSARIPMRAGCRTRRGCSPSAPTPCG